MIRPYAHSNDTQHIQRQINWLLFLVCGARHSITHFRHVIARGRVNKIISWQVSLRTHDVIAAADVLITALEECENKIRAANQKHSKDIPK